MAPVHDAALPDNYAAAGLTLTVPLYAGGLYTAKQQEAQLRAQAAGENLRDLENNVVSDVRITWLRAQNAYDRLHITEQLLENSRQSYVLAQARYRTGISSMVELYQAELNEISAQIAYANTQYEYLLQRSNLSYQTGICIELASSPWHTQTSLYSSSFSLFSCVNVPGLSSSAF